VIDRFICRREGHKPSVTITKITGLVEGAERLPYFTTCQRCGKWYEVQPTARAEAS